MCDVVLAHERHASRPERVDAASMSSTSKTEEFRSAVVEFLDGLISHFVLDSGRLVVVHDGMKERFQGRASGRVLDFALYGETPGETDEPG